MNNPPSEDPKLLNFLHQHRPIIPPEPPDSEDRLMSAIDLLPVTTPQVSRHWWRYLAGGMGIIVTGIVGIAMHQLLNPPEPSLAQLQQLNLYLEAHANPDISTDADSDLFSDNDSDESVDS